MIAKCVMIATKFILHTIYIKYIRKGSIVTHKNPLAFFVNAKLGLGSVMSYIKGKN